MPLLALRDVILREQKIVDDCARIGPSPKKIIALEERVVAEAGMRNHEHLHRERLASGRGRLPELSAEDAEALPDGSMVALDGRPFAVRAGRLLLWSFDGYGPAERLAGRKARLITPPSIVEVLRQGYEPLRGGDAL